jgi:hypothetical protein
MPSSLESLWPPLYEAWRRFLFPFLRLVTYVLLSLSFVCAAIVQATSLADMSYQGFQATLVLKASMILASPVTGLALVFGYFGLFSFSWREKAAVFLLMLVIAILRRA